MYLFSKETYLSRQSKLVQKLASGIVLITGNTESPMNYRDNIYRFRQDSNFRYFFGINLPNLHATIDCATGKTVLYGNEYTMDDIIWIGKQEALASLAEQVGIDEVKPLSSLVSDLQAQKALKFTPPYRHDNMILLSEILACDVKAVQEHVSKELIQAIVDLRSYKSAEEIVQMENAVNITRSMHLAAIQAAHVGKHEYELVAAIRNQLHSHHAELAYPIILSVHGETLHNHHHGNKMESGRIVLNDSGAENLFGYAGDITRCFPVNGSFSNQQKEIYELVLSMEEKSIEALKPGVVYRDVHIEANRIMLAGLKDLELVQGEVDDMIELGIAGLFFPHGLGHMIGMDVHDMEDLGEQYVGYTPDMERSTQLGLKSLRLARKLEAGFVLTVEPGIYFIPELINKLKQEQDFKNHVRFDRLEAYMDFGGIRIEDNILITANGHQILGDYIPKRCDEIENLMQKN